MSRMVHCILFGEEREGLDFQSWPGELGKRIFDNISKEAWEKWLSHQTMLINENRLSPLNPEHRAYLESEMEKFFFGPGSEKPQGYIAPED